MKLLVLLLVVLAGVWWWRSGRRAPQRRSETPSAAPTPQAMVACARCGVHLPQGEAVQGQVALYCSADHRRDAEG